MGPLGVWSVVRILATWVKDSSTGVSRPKMDTSTFSFWVSGLISEIVAGRVSNGPSITVTDSPISKSTTRISLALPAPPPVPPMLAAGAAGCSSGASIAWTSSMLSGIG